MRCSNYFFLRLFACFFLLSTRFPVASRSSCSPRHSCIPHYVMIVVFIFQRLYIRICPTNITRCILSSYLLSFSIRSSSRRNVCNCSLADERGVRKTATSDRIWQDEDERDRFEDFLVSPNYHPSVRMSPIHDLTARHRPPPTLAHSVGGSEEEGKSVYPGIVDV